MSQPETQTIATTDGCPKAQGKRQTTLPFTRIPLKEYHEQVRNCAERTQEERKLERARALEEAANLKQQKREKERLRKQDYRARRRARGASVVVVADDSDASGTETKDTDESSDDPDSRQVSNVSLLEE